MLSQKISFKLYAKIFFFGMLIFQSSVHAQDVLVYEAKFETDAQGWTWQSYTALGGLTSAPTAGWISGVNWPLHGGTAGCIRHNTASANGSWFAKSPDIPMEAGKQYYVKFGVTKSSHTPSDNSRVQIRIGQGAAPNAGTIVLPSQTLPASTVGVVGYIEYESQDLFIPSTTGNYSVRVGDFFTGGSHAVYYDGIRVFEVNNAPLPVTMTAFNALCTFDEVLLQWTTASEHNASHFTVQSSRDGVHWTTLGEVGAAGTTSLTTNYQFTANNHGALTYFRLVQVDLDGAFEIYGPISSTCDNKENRVVLFPNPSQKGHYTSLEIRSNESILDAKLTLIDMRGTIIYSRPLKIELGTNQFNIPTETLNAGEYIIIIQGSTSHFDSQRLIIK